VKIEVSLKIDKKNGHIACRAIYIFFIFRLIILRMRYVAKKKLFFPRKWCRLWDTAEKYSRAGQATWHGACALLAGYLKTANTHSRNV